MEELQNEPLLSNKEKVQSEEKTPLIKKAILGICLAIGLVSGVLIGYVSFGRSSSTTKTTTQTVASSYKVGITYSNASNAACTIFENPTCSGSSGDMDPKWATHLWNTPPRGAEDWKKGYQDMRVLVGYAQLQYNSDRTSCTVTIYTKTHHELSLTYYFDGVGQSEPSKTFDSSYKGLLKVKIVAATGETLELDEIDFIWNVEPLKERQGDYRNGQKGAIVEMFGWPDDDIAEECKVIAEAGYLGVKLFPHQEQVMSTQPFENELNPWYFMYQPVSYRLQGRMGTRTQLRNMIKKCRSYGLRVYADAVVNHMSGSGNDAQDHVNPGASCTYWPGKQSSDEENQSPYYTPAYTYKYNSWGEPSNVLEYPAVPYGPMDFHCDKALNAWTDPNNMNTGWLTGLTDLDTSKDYVRTRIADYFVDLLSIGFSGFRVDAAKHIHPIDLAAIFAKLKERLGGSYPVDFFTWLEVLTGGESWLLVGDSEYSYSTYFSNQLKSQGLTDSEIDQIKIWWSGYPVEPDNDGGRVSKIRKVIQNEDHDQQNDGSSSRDMHDQGCVLVKGCEPAKHRAFEVKLFTDPYGNNVDNDNDYPIRMLLSSYYFKDGVKSPPDGKSDCSLCKTTCETCKSRGYSKAYVADAKAYEGTDYTRVHRDAEIIAAMRSWMHIN
ncbi:Alpha amylase, catalytic domain containing protein [Histomonas meleagridis]|uniref:Alpha amylase, catalytic domain containing protein n=1 Tax=Histomonas meleagridis TaxID=135588 RepID=UPI0035598591|nr:Alpha amylase, catalytic domain containing protein [Histomonas meleagridis]KAH0797285.1 Alpha amylase, catalytic domain containing protein [Histomonas meleagridis]